MEVEKLFAGLSLKGLGITLPIWIIETLNLAMGSNSLWISNQEEV